MNHLLKTVLCIFVASVAVVAQTAEKWTQYLSATDMHEIRVAPGQVSTDLKLTLDPWASGSDTLDIYYSNAALVVSLVRPDGVEITAGSAGGLGYIYRIAASRDHTLIGFPPGQAAGVYVVKVDAQAAKTETVVASMYRGLSSLQAGATVSSTRARPGEAVTIVGLLFNGALPVRNAIVKAHIEATANGEGSELDLLDSGPADAAPGDGAYSAVFTPQTQGKYHIAVRMNGTYDGNIAFSRTASTEIEVRAGAKILSWKDQLIDDDRNGKFDRLVTTATVSVQAAGEYYLSSILDGRGHAEAWARATARLATGTHTMVLSFPSDDILRLGMDGPYRRRSIGLSLETKDGLFLTDSKSKEDAGVTIAVKLSSMDRGPAYFTGPYTAALVSSERNGVFDILRVELGAVTTGGACSWAASLADAKGDDIEGATEYGDLKPGPARLAIDFNGLVIAQSGKNGPYTVHNAEVSCPEGTGVADTLFRTAAFTASQFKLEQPGIVLASPYAAATVVRGGRIEVPVSVDSLGAYDGNATYSASGLPANVTYSTEYSNSAIPGSNTYRFSAGAGAAEGTYPITLQTVSGSFRSSIAFALSVGQPDFSLAAAPGAPVATPGGETIMRVMIMAAAGYSGTVTVSVAGLPAGMVASYSPSAKVVNSGTVLLKLAAGASVKPGEYLLTFTGTDGAFTRKAALMLAVKSAVKGR